jgi:hypothetical protein
MPFSLNLHTTEVQYLAEQVDNPDWAGYDSHQGPHVHDWRTYVPLELQLTWGSFTKPQRVLLVATFQNIADREHWD